MGATFADCPDFEESTARLTCSPAAPNLKFQREDWALFRTVEGLQQKAGVPKNILSRLVLKEITDNALDEGGQVRIGKLPNGGYFVEDGGGGIDGTPDEIARLFSISRPLVSSKLLRLLRHDDLSDVPRGDQGARRAQDQDHQSRAGAVGSNRHGA